MPRAVLTALGLIFAVPVLHASSSVADGAFAITYTQVPNIACMDFVVQAGRGFYDVQVNGTSILSSGGNLDMSATANACAPSTNTVSFIYAKNANTGAAVPAFTPCTVPAPSYQTTTCPTGQGVPGPLPSCSVAGVQQRQDYSCPSFYGASTAGAWYTTAASCAPQCVAPASSTATQQVACPAGQVSSVAPYTPNGVTQNQTTTYTCASCTGTFSNAVGAWTTTANTCVPACSTVTTPGTQALACPAGQVSSVAPYDANGIIQSRTGTQTCATPIGPLNPVTYSPWTTTANTCTPTCAPVITPYTQTVGCPAGYSGTDVQGRTGTQTCATPVGPLGAPAYSPWTDTNNTCVPACSHAASPPTSNPQGCPVGYSGSWTQSRTCSESTSCLVAGGTFGWSCSPWSPASAPGGACIANPTCTPTSGSTPGTFSCPPSQLITTAGAYQYAASAPNATPWTRTCSSPTGSLGAPVYGASAPTYACAPSCSPTSGTTAGVFSCPPGQLISTAGTYQYAASAPISTPWTRTCSGPTGTLGAPVNGAPAPTYACAPACSSSSSTPTQNQPCPANTTGPGWTQTQSCTASCASPIGPLGSPSCGGWTPAAAPAGVCTPIAPPPPVCGPVPAPTTGAKNCAMQCAAPPSTYTQTTGWVAAPAPICWTQTGATSTDDRATQCPIKGQTCGGQPSCTGYATNLCGTGANAASYGGYDVCIVRSGQPSAGTYVSQDGGDTSPWVSALSKCGTNSISYH